MPLAAFAAPDLRAVVVAYRDALIAHREAINSLNVYPVPDGDTGTNMALTLRSVVEELDGADDTLEGICDAIAHGSLMGARGNSGVIMSQIMRGFVGVVRSHAVTDGPVFAEALSAAAKGAYGAVGNPVEGTILTVVREAGEAALTAASRGGDLVAVLDAARAEGSASLERTPTLLQVLADAGVVDAGGLGLLLFVDAALWVADQRPVPEPEDSSAGDRRDPRSLRDRPAAATEGSGIADLRYEVMFLLDAPDDSIGGFKAAWAEVGDSIVVVGGDGLFNCHIHCDDIGAAIECGIDVGRPRRIRVSDLLTEVDESDWVLAELGTARGSGHGAGADPPADPVPTAVVAVGVGRGVVSILRSMGAQAVIAGGQTMNPSTADLVEAAENVGAPEVVILPNNSNIIPVAEQVDSLTGRAVRVVPTRSVVEALACLMVYDPQASAEVNAANMTVAAAEVVASEVTRAVRDATTAAGPVTAGDWLGIARDGIAVVAPTMADAATALLAAIIRADHELLTVIVGADADTDATAAIQAWARSHHRDLEIEVHQGDQPLYPYYFGLE